ncbi:hypothetical protein Tco_0922896 [Tanacetum coccineum]|uniref:Retrovirus-related Pol polyprotein from transposon TNT 1-94-like beta-barrel domain-containing protein n=1 Tax=Tanacetum coccineum TaxID=301880 RepID=A0ABQ5D291_9ASTR
MDSQSTQTIKLPILQPGEYDLWKMRMEQYLYQTSYKDAKTLMQAIENRFGGNTTTKKTHKNLLKQQYENFVASNTEVIEQTYERLQKQISQLEIHGEVIPQEDINQKLAFLSLAALTMQQSINTTQGVNTVRNSGSADTPNFKKFLKKTGRKLYWPKKKRLEVLTSQRWIISTATREDTLQRPQESRQQNKEPIRRTVPVEETTSNALLSQCDGFGYDIGVTQQKSLEYVEARLLVFKKNESVYEEELKLLKSEIYLRDLDIIELKRKLELATKEKDERAVVEKPTVETNEPKTSRKVNGSLIIEDWVSDSDEENVPKSTEQVKSPRKTSVDKYRQNTPSPRGNKRNWNQQMSQKLGSDFEMFNKACHVCGSFDHLKNNCNNCYNNGRFAKPVWTNIQRVNKQNFSKLTHPSPKRNVVPRTVLTRSGPISVNAVRPVNTIQSRTAVNNAGPMKNVINNAYSTARRPFNKITAANNSNFTKKVNTIKGTRVNTARPKAVLSVVKENKGNAVKASTCWVWRPKHKILDHGNPQQDLKNKGVIDSGCSRHMTGNRSYLTDYKEIDGGFVAFGGNSKGGKITGKGKIKTGKLDFEDVYFVKELKFNLFSVSQMCDKKNSVLFTDTECVVLSPDFKLTDESHALLKVPKKDNMCSVDLKNVVPQGGLTCLFTKATPDESNLWHMRRGHVNFKTNDKRRTRIVEENLHVQFSENTSNITRSGPNWLFDIDALTNSMNYKPVVIGNQSNGNAGIKECVMQVKATNGDSTIRKDYILLPMWPANPLFSQNSKESPDARFKTSGEEEKKDAKDPVNESGNPTEGKDSEVLSTEEPKINQEKDDYINNTNNINTASDGNSTNNVNAASSTVNAADTEVNAFNPKTSIKLSKDPIMLELEDIFISDEG